MDLPKIVVTGSLAFDYIMNFPGDFKDHINPDKVHVINLSFLVSNLKKERGGTAGNIAYSLGLLQESVAIVSAAGHDFSDYKKYLKKNGVDISNIKVHRDEFSARAYILTDLRNNQITSFYPGAMKYTKSLKLNGNAAKFVVIAPDDPESMNNFVNECQQKNLPYLYDPGMQLPSLRDTYLRQGIKEAKILIGNDYEIGLIKNRLNFSEKDFLDFVEVLIITLGEKGSIIKTKEREYFIDPVKPKQIADQTS
ncbi:carbohydrate kinase family protein [Candidatus Daviesbacteria bacterium]|nr:carbohydrate kinase family protein [Candidatus Daviesbacteria bacterium]